MFERNKTASTYRAGKVLGISSHSGQLAISMLDNHRPTGQASCRGQIAVGAGSAIHFLNSKQAATSNPQPEFSHDRCFVPRWKPVFLSRLAVEDRCLGLWGDGQTLWMSSLYQSLRFENVLERGQSASGFDRLYVSQIVYRTGEMDIHDVAVEKSDRVVFVKTLFGCLATISDTHSFVPLWKPLCTSKLAAEDRCHLNEFQDRRNPSRATYRQRKRTLSDV